MKATVRMEDAVSMATGLSTARQLQSPALWRRQMRRAATELPPACQRGGWQSRWHRERKLCAHPRLEIYQQDQIYFMCPLARQGDFYVPEVKETERKCRGLLEASDAQMDGTDTWIYVAVDSHPLTLATQIQRPCLDSLQMPQEYPWKHRSQTAGCSWEGTEAAQERNRLGGAPQEVKLALDLEGADTMSETSSISLEVSPGSRETSAATLSPRASSRAWDDGDTRSEHSYSESGASGSSFEELDLESEGPLGEPQLDPETEPLGATKWPQEPSIPEKGKE
ncbi:testis-expressed protein 264 isoform X3 [Cynocephalus volans]|uniref:testis-expressed protein 264 isoform X3 n=1 Tax=Cynocephalus volans TaxID=110931 RepID=UPI002FC8E578